MLVYLDHNATTPVTAGVERAMSPWFRQRFGNPRSRDHRYGWDANESVEISRGLIADAVGAKAGDIRFCGGATDALKEALDSFVGYSNWPAKRIVTGATEHPAVLDTCRRASQQTGVEVVVVPVDSGGQVNLERVADALTPDKANLLALAAANSEIGTIAPVGRVGTLARSMGATLLCDATQGVGKMPLDLAAWDMFVFSSHKIYGPKGIGVLVRSNDKEPSGLSAPSGGTPNVPAIVGLAEACRELQGSPSSEIERMSALRTRLEGAILAELPDTWVNGDLGSRLCNTSNVGFRGIDARTMIRDMHDIAVSTRSACSSGNSGPSHVLKAIGLSDEDAYSCIRFSLGRFTTQEEIDYTIEKVVTSAHKLRKLKSVRAN